MHDSALTLRIHPGGGGIDGAIHNAAGEKLFEECKTLPVVQIIGENTEIRCPEGRTKITRGYNLPAKCTLHSPLCKCT